MILGLSRREPALRSFVRALVAPAHERSDGTRIARVVAQMRVQLVYPSYLGRDSAWLENPTEIEAPVGTSLDVQVTPLIPAERGRLRAGSRSAPLTAADDGTLHGRLSAQEAADMRVEIESHGARYEDPRAIALHVRADQTPVISIEEPRNGSLAPPSEAISLLFLASDDVGLASVNLFARMEDGSEKQRQVFSALDDGGPQQQLRSGIQLVPAELGAREGETLVLWLEARDADLVSGPHAAKSREITLEVAEPGRGLSELIPSLQQIADTAVDLLGDRLENAVPQDAQPAKGRFSSLEHVARAWLAACAGATNIYSTWKPGYTLRSRAALASVFRPTLARSTSWSVTWCSWPTCWRARMSTRPKPSPRNCVSSKITSKACSLNSVRRIAPKPSAS
jgi:hypothetical protein